MAFIRDKAVFTSALSATFDLSAESTPEHQAGDLIMYFISQDGAYTSGSSTGSEVQIGYSGGGTQGCAVQVWYKVAASSSEVMPTFTARTEEWAVHVVVIGDPDPTTPIHAYATSASPATSQQTDSPGLVTTIDGCLILRCWVQDSNDRYTVTPPGAATLLDWSASIGVGTNVEYTVQQTAGTVPTATLTNADAGEGCACIEIAVANASGGSIEPYTIDPYEHVVVVSNGTSGPGIDSNFTTGAEAPNTHIATINGKNVGTTAIAGGYNEAVGNVMRRHFLSTAAEVLVWNGIYLQMTAPVDVTGGLLCLTYVISADNYILTRGHVFCLIDSAGNYRVFRLRPKALLAADDIVDSWIDAENGEVYEESGTPPDLTDIDTIAVFVDKSNSTNGQSVRMFNLTLSKEGTAVILGGGPNQPIAAPRITRLMSGHVGYARASFQGSGQLVYPMHLTIGNGSAPTYLKLDGESWETPRNYKPSANRYDYNIDADLAIGGMTLYGCAACVFDLRNAIIACTVPAPFKIHASSHASTTVLTDLAQFRSFSEVQWSSNYACHGAAFVMCGEVDGKAAAFSDCTFSSPSGTYALKLDDGGSATGCAFDGAEASDFAIRIPAAGSYDLSLNTYTTYTTPIKVTATTGTVTISLDADDDEPAYSSDGATVVFDQAVAGTSWTNEDLVDGTAVLVINTTTDTTIDYEVVSGGAGYTISMVPGVDYTVGDVIEVRQAYKDGTTYYQERTSTIITTSGGGDLVEADALAVCPICTALGIDGEDYDTAFDLDSTDDELDLITAGSWQTGQLMTWWKWQMTIQVAMEEFWGAWAVQVDGSFRNDVDIMDSQVDTTETGDSVESTGRRIYRSDGARPIKSPTTGGGAIDLSWRDPVTVVATGSGVLPADITAIAALTNSTSDALQLGQFIALK